MKDPSHLICLSGEGSPSTSLLLRVGSVFHARHVRLDDLHLSTRDQGLCVTACFRSPMEKAITLLRTLERVVGVVGAKLYAEGQEETCWEPPA